MSVLSGASLRMAFCGLFSTLCRIISIDFRSADPPTHPRAGAVSFPHPCVLIVPNGRRLCPQNLPFSPLSSLVYPTPCCRLQSSANAFSDPSRRSFVLLGFRSKTQGPCLALCFFSLHFFPLPHICRRQSIIFQYSVAYSITISKRQRFRVISSTDPTGPSSPGNILEILLCDGIRAVPLFGIVNLERV